MRVLVGTLYCGENELPECIASLEAQTHGAWEQFIVRDLPNKIAHETLYQTFMSRAGEFDLFLKLDADMVLEDPRMLERIEAYFHEHPKLDGITICVHDFYSNVLIHGMHVYRSSVRWTSNDELLFVDDSPVDAQRLRIDVRELAPAASHCKNPSPFFAFRFGVHRGIKAREALASGGKRRSAAPYYLQTIEQVWKHLQHNRDPRLALAALGAELALDGSFTVEDVDPKSRCARRACEQYADLSADELLSRATALRRRHNTKIPLRRLRIVRYRLARSIESAIGGIWPTLVRCVPASIRDELRTRSTENRLG